MPRTTSVVSNSYNACQQRYNQVRRAFIHASTAQRVAYVIVAFAICTCIALAIHRSYYSVSTNVTEAYKTSHGGNYSKKDSCNCDSEQLLGLNRVARTRKTQCNQGTAPQEYDCEACQVTYPHTVHYENPVVVQRRHVAGNSLATPDSGMQSIKFCSDEPCNKKRTLRDVVDEYKHHHIPFELNKVYKNQAVIESNLQTVGKDVCAYNVYATELDNENTKIEQDTIQPLVKQRNFIKDTWDTFNEQLPKYVKHSKPIN